MHIIRFLRAHFLIFLLFVFNISAQNEFTDKKFSSLSASDEISIKSVVTQYFAAYPKKDISADALHWSRNSPNFASHQKELEKAFGETERIVVKTLTFGRLVLTGEKVKVRLVAEIEAIEIKTGKRSDVFGSSNRVLMLGQEEGKWKIFDYISAEKELAARLVEAKTEAERQQILKEAAELRNGYLGTEIINQGNHLYGKIPVAKLLEIYRLGTDTAFQFGQDEREFLEVFEKGLKISQEMGDKEIMARFALFLGNNAVDNEKNIEKAIDYYEKSFSAAREIDNQQLMALIQFRTGMAQGGIGNYVKAEIAFRNSLAIAEHIGDTSQIALSLNWLAKTLTSVGKNSDEALEYFDRSLKLEQARGDKSRMEVVLYSIGNVFVERGDFAKAMLYYQKSVEVSGGVNY